MMEKIIQGKEITETQMVADLLTGTDIGTWQADYLLREVEFERIKNGMPITFNLAYGLFLTTIGFGLPLLAKGYSNIGNITTGERITLVAGLAVSVILYAIGLCLPNNRKTVMKKIEKHFADAPTIRQAVKEQGK